MLFYNTIKLLQNKLSENQIKAELNYRVKEPVSTFNKMLCKEATPDQINDLIGIRILVSIKCKCYQVLDMLQTLDEFNIISIKDYIVTPKVNHYQAIHVVIYSTLYKRKIEIQIRSTKMHHHAERGGADHFQYKQRQRFLSFNIDIPEYVQEMYELFNKTDWTERKLFAYELALYKWIKEREEIKLSKKP